MKGFGLIGIISVIAVTAFLIKIFYGYSTMIIELGGVDTLITWLIAVVFLFLIVFFSIMFFISNSARVGVKITGKKKYFINTLGIIFFILPFYSIFFIQNTLLAKRLVEISIAGLIALFVLSIILRFFENKEPNEQKGI